jgi:hypothetical protein
LAFAATTTASLIMSRPLPLTLTLIGAVKQRGTAEHFPRGKSERHLVPVEPFHVVAAAEQAKQHERIKRRLRGNK